MRPLARDDDRIVGITAAMADGTSLDRFNRVFPDRFYDVGIAEQHAVTFAAGLATEGMKPVAAIYSTFLQRAYDQVVHDVCIQNLDVTFAMDRAGLVGADGATHQGFYDCAPRADHPPRTAAPAVDGDAGFCGWLPPGRSVRSTHARAHRPDRVQTDPSCAWRRECFGRTRPKVSSSVLCTRADH